MKDNRKVNDNNNTVFYYYEIIKKLKSSQKTRSEILTILTEEYNLSLNEAEQLIQKTEKNYNNLSASSVNTLKSKILEFNKNCQYLMYQFILCQQDKNFSYKTIDEIQEEVEKDLRVKCVENDYEFSYNVFNTYFHKSDNIKQIITKQIELSYINISKSELENRVNTYKVLIMKGEKLEV